MKVLPFHCYRIFRIFIYPCICTLKFAHGVRFEAAVAGFLGSNNRGPSFEEWCTVPRKKNACAFNAILFSVLAFREFLGTAPLIVQLAGAALIAGGGHVGRAHGARSDGRKESVPSLSFRGRGTAIARFATLLFNLAGSARWLLGHLSTPRSLQNTYRLGR